MSRLSPIVGFVTCVDRLIVRCVTYAPLALWSLVWKDVTWSTGCDWHLVSPCSCFWNICLLHNAVSCTSQCWDCPHTVSKVLAEGGVRTEGDQLGASRNGPLPNHFVIFDARLCLCVCVCPHVGWTKWKSTWQHFAPCQCFTQACHVRTASWKSGVWIHFVGIGDIQSVPGGNVPDFRRMFLKLKYTDLTKNTYMRSWTVTEIMAREKCGLLAVPRTVPGSRVVLPVYCACPSFSLQPGETYSRCNCTWNPKDNCDISASVYIV